jgi:hypothetical protein
MLTLTVNMYDGFYGTKINWFSQRHQDGFRNERLTCLTYDATGFCFRNGRLFVFVFAFDDLVFASSVYPFLFSQSTLLEISPSDDFILPKFRL